MAARLKEDLRARRLGVRPHEEGLPVALRPHKERLQVELRRLIVVDRDASIGQFLAKLEEQGIGADLFSD